MVRFNVKNFILQFLIMFSIYLGWTFIFTCNNIIYLFVFFSFIEIGYIVNYFILYDNNKDIKDYLGVINIVLNCLVLLSIYIFIIYLICIKSANPIMFLAQDDFLFIAKALICINIFSIIKSISLLKIIKIIVNKFNKINLIIVYDAIFSIGTTILLYAVLKIFMKISRSSANVYEWICVLTVYFIISFLQFLIIIYINKLSKGRLCLVYPAKICIFLLIIFLQIIISNDFSHIISSLIPSKITDFVSDIEKKKEFDDNNILVIDEILNKIRVVDIRNAKIGDIVKFGKSFTKDSINKKIDSYYIVADDNDDELKLISVFLIDKLDVKKYINTNGRYLFSYLNDKFYKNSFNNDEKKLIIEKYYGDDEIHKVYIPSINDLMKKNVNNKFFDKILDKNAVKFLKLGKSKENDSVSYILANKLKQNVITIKGIDDEGFGMIEDIDYSDNILDNMEIFMRPMITIKRKSYE